jgi:hypothetical protein
VSIYTVRAEVSMVAASQSVREVALCIGADQGIVAVRTDPAQRSSDTGVLLLNAGVIHRIGPHRLHVTLARQFAAMGLAALRLDLSGIGDSRAIPGTLSFRDSAVADIRTAMDQFSTDCAVHHFLLFGLCSGADNALAAAAVDLRITALILVDAPAYATRQSRRRHWLSRLPQGRGLSSLPSCLLALARVGWHSLASRFAARRSVHAKHQESARKPPPQAEFESMVTALVDRGTRILFVYSDALGVRYNAKDQLFEAFPSLRERVDVAYFPGTNHVFTEHAQRERLVACVLDWSKDLRATSS